MKTDSMRNAYGEALVQAGKSDERIVVLDCDLSKATKTSLFAKEFPKRFFNVGIAEQNMMSLAAGLASCGKIPFALTLAVFASMRACEQVRTSICIGRLNVKIGGAYGGLVTAENGPTHQCIGDIAIMRCLPNMTVLAPSDAAACKACVRWAVAHDGPVYIRVLRDEEPCLYGNPEDVNVRSGNRLKEGHDIAILSNGFMTHLAVEAAWRLEAEGVSALVHDIISVKPLDTDLIVSLADECGAVLTVEEHTVMGGVGSAIAEVLIAQRPVYTRILGINDRFSDSGSHEVLLERAGLTVNSIMHAARSIYALKEKQFHGEVYRPRR